MTDKIDQIIDDKEDIKVQLGKQDLTDGIPFFWFFRSNKLRPKVHALITRRSITGTAFVLDDPTYNEMDNSSILMDTGYTTWKEVHKVISPNKVWKEYFRQNTFMDGANTTADPDYTNNWIDFTSNEVYQTVAIFKNSESINTALVYANVGSESNAITLTLPAGGQQVNFT